MSVTDTSAAREASAGVLEWRKSWYLPVVAGIGYATSALHLYSLGAFIEPLQLEFGWSRAQISAGASISAFVTALCSIPAGLLVDKIGPRIGIIGVLLMPCAFALLGTATGTQFNWLLLWVVVGFGTLLLLPMVWTTAVNRRFVASRGMALAVTLSGGSVAAALFPLLSAWLIDALGWRQAYMAMAGIWAAIVFPLIYLFFRREGPPISTPPSATAETSTATETVPGLTLKESLRTGDFYKLFIAGAGIAITSLGLIVHFIPILKDYGADSIGAASTASLIGVFSIVGRMGTGFLLDRLPAHVVGSLVAFIPIAGCILLLTSGEQTASQTVSAALFGLTLGSEADLIAYVTARQFGLRHYGAVYGAMLVSLALGTMLGTVAAGAAYDAYGAYAPFLGVAIVVLLVSATCLISLGPIHKAPVEKLSRDMDARLKDLVHPG